MSEAVRSYLIMAACEYLSSKPSHINGFCYWAKHWENDESIKVHDFVDEFMTSHPAYRKDAYCHYDKHGYVVEGCTKVRLQFVEQLLHWLITKD